MVFVCGCRFAELCAHGCVVCTQSDLAKGSGESVCFPLRPVLVTIPKRRVGESVYITSSRVAPANPVIEGVCLHCLV